MSYQKTIWVPGETKVSAENMNNIESGIEENSLKLDELQNEIPTNVSDLNNDLGFISEATATETFQQKITDYEKLNADLVSTENSTNKFVTNQDIDNWNSKQDAMQPGVDYATPGSVDETVATKQDKFATVFKPSPMLNVLGLEKETFVTGSATFSDPTKFLSSINLSGSKIQSVADPTNDTDVATKRYVDDNVAEKSFELIENYTMPKTAAFSSQYEPDSTPYNFKALLVYITNNTESNLVVSLVLNTEGVTYTSIAAGATSPSLFIVYGNRLIPISLTTASKDGGARNNYAPRQRAIGMAINSITSIGTSGQLPAGTEISIYGVRA